MVFSHSELRQRQRLTSTRSVTVEPCPGRSFNLRQYRLWRELVRIPHFGHNASDGPRASTCQPFSVRSKQMSVSSLPGRNVRPVTVFDPCLSSLVPHPVLATKVRENRFSYIGF